MQRHRESGIPGSERVQFLRMNGHRNSRGVSVVKLTTCSAGGTDLRYGDVTTIKNIFPQALRNWARHRRAFHGGGV
jgi:hypothetical protein